ncbi:low molecular weight protein-tyrosine-phosphatase [Candidatus Igneacidithiobacillus taiwanensis]|uniref:low molecular weight protein-tyrosine-phosphatase n=1 Tax=Candidatus Igneacidithiobacillus taiwanensis TaxID=1945924 RepID=UPI0028A21EC0|nr:low molecular weight protein-tyrosine-phosphatase [Candidatus Igneacidithiobacillus taiwanensis]MCE5359789.1 low molecular weight phosphotyrosine protein phosphatase [Acidithiobacillus sp.]
MKLLLVCLGNICRSPMAEGIFRQLTAQRGLAWEIDSAGTADYHVGEPPDRRAQRASAELGIAIGDLRARQVNEADFSHFDWILAMDGDNLHRLRALAGSDCKARLGLLRDPFLQHPTALEVADPYWGNLDDFLACAEQIRQAAEAFLQRIDKKES